MRSAWSRFMISLVLRMPADIAALRARWKDLFPATDPESEAEYAKLAKDGDPPTFSEYIAQMPVETVEKHLFEVFVPLVDNKNIGNVINDMVWSVVHTETAGFDLLTSDRPIIRTPLRDDLAHVILPIGPRLLFVAVNNADTLKQVQQIPIQKLVRITNQKVVEQATKLVIGRDDKQLRFATNHFGAEPVESLIKVAS